MNKYYWNRYKILLLENRCLLHLVEENPRNTNVFNHLEHQTIHRKTRISKRLLHKVK